MSDFDGIDEEAIQNYKYRARSDSRDEDPEDADVERFERDEMVKCPHCGKMNHPEALTCRVCKYYIIEKGSVAGTPIWVKVTCLVMLALIALGGFYMSGYGADFRIDWNHLFK